MKRTREELVGVDMANILMLLSCRLETNFKKCSSSPNHVFECKTCKRQFPSFQALGGHRASHKRPRTLMGSDQDPKSETESGKGKTQKRECSICGLEFSSGQALGGHMRRHRMTNAGSSSPVPGASKIPVLMRSNSKRVFCSGGSRKNFQVRQDNGRLKEKGKGGKLEGSYRFWRQL